MTYEAVRASPQGFLRERRSARRYSIALELEWKLFSRKRLLDTGTGKTVDLSNGGIEADHKPAAAGFMEPSTTWPARPENFRSIDLTVIGRVVRVAGTHVAIRIRQHGFSMATRERAG
jgi:hypothetical protein